jgi:hypothetical protein
MKLLRPLALALLLSLPALADEGIFPGVRVVLTPAEWKRAGLDRLSPDEIGVIDAAVIRHYLRMVTGVGPLPPPAASAPATAKARVESRGTSAASVPPPATSTGLWDRLGLGKNSDADWRAVPPLIARCTGWAGGNRFTLDNGQVWEGLDNIPFELEGKQVIIEARPLGNFALKLDEKSAIVRVKRLK